MQKVITYIKIGGAAMSGVYEAWQFTSLIFPSQVSAPFGRPSWLSLGIGFLVFVLFVVWGWGSASWRLGQHEKTHPSVKITPSFDGKYTYLDITNTGHEKAEFQVQVLQWVGFLQGEELIAQEDKETKRGLTPQPKPVTPYYLRWKNNINSVNNPKYELLSTGNNKTILMDDISMVSFSTDVKTLYRVQLPTNETNYTGIVELGKEIMVTIQCISSPTLKTKNEKTFRLLLGDDGKWKLFEELVK